MFSLLNLELARAINDNRLREAAERRLAADPGAHRRAARRPAPVGALRRAAGRGLITFGSWVGGVALPAGPSHHPAAQVTGRCAHCLW